MENHRILLIDDNHSIHEDYRKILCPATTDSKRRLADLKTKILKKSNPPSPQQNFILDSAFQGQEGYEKSKVHWENGEPYALAFVDMRMPPGWDGLETILHLWEVDPELQIVIGSAFSDYDWSQIIERVGISENLVILKKPFDKEEVLQVAHALTKKWDLHRQTQTLMELLEDKVAERTQELTVANRQLKKEMQLRERMEVELRLAQKLEAIGQLAAGIAHEINTPIQFVGDNLRFLTGSFKDIQKVLDVYTQVIQTLPRDAVDARLLDAMETTVAETDLEYVTKEIPQSLKQSLDGAERVANIVRAMKVFSHPGTGEKTPIDLNHAIESTVTVAQNEWKYVAEVSTEFDHMLPLVPCLPGEFNQVILNLLVNAAHAIEAVVEKEKDCKGRITISTRKAVDGVEILIADTGSGIPEAARSKIFDPFFTTKDVGKGTGQGLPMAHDVIVNKHGGRLTFTTTLGTGTTFVIQLPSEPTAVIGG